MTALVSCLVCGMLTEKHRTGRCVPHQRAQDRQRQSRRGDRYNAAHRATREAYTALVNAGMATCARCGKPINPAGDWHLDHNDDGSGYLGPSHPGCNSAATSRRR